MAIAMTIAMGMTIVTASAMGMMMAISANLTRRGVGISCSGGALDVYFWWYPRPLGPFFGECASPPQSCVISSRRGGDGGEGRERVRTEREDYCAAPGLLFLIALETVTVYLQIQIQPAVTSRGK